MCVCGGGGVSHWGGGGWLAGWLAGCMIESGRGVFSWLYGQLAQWVSGSAGSGVWGEVECVCLDRGSTWARACSLGVCVWEEGGYAVLGDVTLQG